jgi:beta-N-acetylhexosaminidase
LLNIIIILIIISNMKQFFILLQILFTATCAAEMSIEEKVGQLLMVHFTGVAANEDAVTLIKKAHVGGFIYYNWANGLTSPQQVKTLSQSLQKLSKIPLLIAIDQEGGQHIRLVNGFTVFPSNAEIDPAQVQEAAYTTGKELLAVGINLNLAPVIDVNVNPKNPIIGKRSFSASPEVVAACGARALEGYHQAHILTSLKHFPGHGDVAIDSHIDLPVVNKAKAELERVELLPFRKLLPFADTIMTAHIIMPALDPKNCATLSPLIIEGLLRKEMHYDGVVISDSLVMKGLLKNCRNVEDAATRAILAGCDIILLGGKQLLEHDGDLELNVLDVLNVHQSLVQAVKAGVIPEARLNQSVSRIQRLKSQLTNKL